MAVSSSRRTILELSGDFVASNSYAAASNPDSPAQRDIVALIAGDNVIAPPSGGTLTCLTIIPPAGNTSLITLMGNIGDQGIPLHLTDPSSIALDETFAGMVLNAFLPVDDLILIWS